MIFVNYDNSGDFLSHSDQELFETVTGISISYLENLISKQQTNLVKVIYSNHKFIENYELNKIGLHVYRKLLAHRVYEARNHASDNFCKEFNDFGIVEKNDFLEKSEFNKIRQIFDTKVRSKYPSGTFVNVDPTNFFKRNDHLLSTIKDFCHIENFRFGMPAVNFWDVLHFEDDPQSKFHSDTFQPTCKFWIYLQDVEAQDGPFNFVPETHLITKERLTWELENSLLKKDTSLWKERIQKGGKPGSFRFFENSSTEQEETKLKASGLDFKEMIGKQNTFVAANTVGFHRRGHAKPGTSRVTLTIEYRPQAFVVY